MAETDHEDFAKWVHDALRQLYDSHGLRSSPLNAILGMSLGDPQQRGQGLRRALLEAIRALRPASGTPARSPDWRAYRILEFRYIEGLHPDEVMERVALSRSHYYHEQARALDALVASLWNTCQAQAEQRDVAVPEGQPTRQDLIRTETARILPSAAPQESVELASTLRDLQPVIEQLAAAQQVGLKVDAWDPVLVIQADRILLRQAILEAVTWALAWPGIQSLEISTLSGGDRVGIWLRAHGGRDGSTPAGAAPSVQEAMDTCCQLVDATKGQAEIRHGPATRDARLTWLASPPRRLLVIDDNVGFEDLFRRYLADQAWEVLGARDGAQARSLIAEVAPAVIILDVLLPQEDGWELLMALRRDEATRETPIIVCSVFNQPRTALALGASAYLTKPVSPQELLRALAAVTRPDATPEPGQ